jgi:hypothetical protein
VSLPFVLQTLKGNFLPAGKFGCNRICRGRNSVSTFPAKPGALGKLQRYRYKPGYSVRTAEGATVSLKVNCCGYFRWSAGSAGTGNFLDPILDPIQEFTCGLMVKYFLELGTRVFP